MTNEVTDIYAPGLYFGLPFDEYLADPALDFTGMKRLLISPLTYWVNSRMNPDFEDCPTEAMVTGKAFHARILEGAETFAQHYAVLPDKADYPNALDGAAELRAKCAELELKKGGTIADLCVRIHEAAPKLELWPIIDYGFRFENKDKTFLKPDVGRQIERLAGLVEAHPSAAKAFTGGFAEVSVFWTDGKTGVRLKARLDYLKRRAVVDLKTFSNPLGKPLDVAIAHAVAYGRYHMQAVIYSEAAATLREAMLAEHIVDIRQDNLAFVFVFIEQGKVPNLRVREFKRQRSKTEETLAYQSGFAAFRHAVDLYVKNRDRFGAEPWIDDTPMTPFADEDFPIWMME
jgi:hypothetical protein